MNIDYDAYLNSDAWKARRKVALGKAAYKCQLCGNKKQQLDIHHNTYERLGNERDEDLIVLCHDCHTVFHAHRDPRTMRKFEAQGIPKPEIKRGLPTPPSRSFINDNAAGRLSSQEINRARRAEKRRRRKEAKRRKKWEMAELTRPNKPEVPQPQVAQHPQPHQKQLSRNEKRIAKFALPNPPLATAADFERRRAALLSKGQRF